MLYASPLVLSAFASPTVCTLANLFEEYNLSGADLIDACVKLKEILNAFQIDVDPPIGSLGTDDIRVLKRVHPEHQRTQKLVDLLKVGESYTTEFKSSIFINTKQRESKPDTPLKDCVDERLKERAAKEIAALLNADGGVIVFGVTDEHKVRGCEEDFTVFEKGGSPSDKADQIFKQIIDKYFLEPDSVFFHLQIEVTQHEQKNVVVVSIAPRQRLAFLKNVSTPLYVRSGTNAIPIPFERIEQFFKLVRR